MTVTNGKWSGFRELVLIDVTKECEGIKSFYFKAKDSAKLVRHIAGQFLPIRIKTDNPKYKDIIRTYSLSMIPNEDVYRISVKKVDGGLISSYLHDSLNIGDSIEAMIPTGLFTLRESSTENPLVFISGGIGITPLISMLYYEALKRKNITFIQAVINSSVHPFKNDIDYFADINGLKNFVFYSDPLKSDIKGIDYTEKGYVTKEWLEKNTPLNGDFYFCGPPPFMNSVKKSLSELGVPEDRIHFESFTQ